MDEAVRLFERHVKRIAAECQNRGIPFQMILMSSLKNWGMLNLMQILRELYFPAKRVQA